jgi:hypothetical protein
MHAEPGTSRWRLTGGLARGTVKLRIVGGTSNIAFCAHNCIARYGGHLLHIVDKSILCFIIIFMYTYIYMYILNIFYV